MARGLIEKKLFITDHIRKFNPVSRQMISQRFNMNAATVGNIVDTLIKEGTVMETDIPRPADSGAGRPAIGLKLNPDGGCFIGIDMFDCLITAVLTNFECNPLHKYHVAFDENASATNILQTVRDAVQTLMAEHRGKTVLKGIGMGLPGRINLKDGTAIDYHRIAGWRNIPFAATLSHLFGVPVFVEHNSSTVALAEAWKYGGETGGVVASVLVRTGVSIGLAQNREIINHSTYSAGELGHTIIDFNGSICRCGRRGCLETYASGTALARMVEQTAAIQPGWAGAEALLSDPVDADLICRLATEGNPECTEILSKIFRHLSIGIDTVLSLYAPDILTINGIFNRAAPLLKELIRKNCPALHPETVLIIDPYDQRIGAVGAALHAASRTCNPLHQIPG
ncbi:MAG: ROK family protein [Kiritimatiellales bacterium]|nr:ROK family protein [Kiritimatiellales bacterium]